MRVLLGSGFLDLQQGEESSTREFYLSPQTNYPSVVGNGVCLTTGKVGNEAKRIQSVRRPACLRVDWLHSLAWIDGLIERRAANCRALEHPSLRCLIGQLIALLLTVFVFDCRCQWMYEVTLKRILVPTKTKEARLTSQRRGFDKGNTLLAIACVSIARVSCNMRMPCPGSLAPRFAFACRPAPALCCPVACAGEEDEKIPGVNLLSFGWCDKRYSGDSSAGKVNHTTSPARLRICVIGAPASRAELTSSVRVLTSFPHLSLM